MSKYNKTTTPEGRLIISDSYSFTTVEVVEDSISPEGKRLTTLLLKYPRSIHGEQMTHRVFSRNGQSSRAVPVKKGLKEVWSNPVEPIVWAYNKAGMQATEPMSNFRAWVANKIWRSAAKFASFHAYLLLKVGLHKQWANRILEPFQTYTAVVTSTEWENYFELRCHKDAQPEMRDLAEKIRYAMRYSKPKELNQGEWHMPFVTKEEKESDSVDLQLQKSTARAARASYLNHDKTFPSEHQDVSLFNRLVSANPLHASPAEHQATPDKFDKKGWNNPRQHGNFEGWIQHRKHIEENLDSSGLPKTKP